MNLIIDAGNTSVKLAVFDKENLLFDTNTASENFIKQVKNIFNLYSDITWAIVSAVGNLNEKDITALSIFCQVHVLDFVFYTTNFGC